MDLEVAYLKKKKWSKVMVIIKIIVVFLLVGGFKPPEKYESQLGWLFQICGKKMFQTTNQYSKIHWFLFTIHLEVSKVMGSHGGTPRVIIQLWMTMN